MSQAEAWTTWWQWTWPNTDPPGSTSPSGGLTWSPALTTWLPTFRSASAPDPVALPRLSFPIVSPPSHRGVVKHLSNRCVCSDPFSHPVSWLQSESVFFSAYLIGLIGWDFFSFSLPQGELHVSKLFHHTSILPYKSVFIAENELWVITPFMAFGKK